MIPIPCCHFSPVPFRSLSRSGLSEAAQVSDEDEDDADRRYPRRRRVAPLEYWRGEKFVYGRRQSGAAAVPIIKEVLRMPPAEVQRLGSTAARGRSVSKKPIKKKGKKKDDSDEDSDEEGGSKRRRKSKYRDQSPEVPEETGWDKETSEHGVVWDYVKKQEVERRALFGFLPAMPCFFSWWRRRRRRAERFHPNLFADQPTCPLFLTCLLPTPSL